MYCTSMQSAVKGPQVLCVKRSRESLSEQGVSQGEEKHLICNFSKRAL